MGLEVVGQCMQCRAVSEDADADGCRWMCAAAVAGSKRDGDE